ncbi:DUF2946 family protein [Novipirellula artificiosorum]|uniref:DUF2946 domain-containing protein n=1 Tax=Novipirellula artificiosorum TaxID=2528016 RepID=A0A5C6D1R5_9BACT|nr:DUF2946 family protein [Novipirellula artificiosorum]TWU31123.1 hypothetical protein Poly41_63140 [Novipirellula artificiosorum]
MSSLIRPILASLLCGVIVLGHAPVWLHVGHCEHHAHVQSGVASDKTASVVIYSHVCQHHAPPQETAKTVSDTHDAPVSGGQHDHDSDTCVICQSLASPGGVTWELLVSLPFEIISSPVFVAPEPVLAATLLSIPQPRGPPVVA